MNPMTNSPSSGIIRLGLKTKILLLVGSVTSILLLTVFTLFIVKGKELIIAHLERSSISVTRALSVFVLDSQIKDANGFLQAEDVLGHYILNFMEKNPNILAIVVYGPQDHIVAGSGVEDAGIISSGFEPGDRGGAVRSIVHQTEEGTWVASVFFPLVTGEKYWGSLFVHFRADDQHREVNQLFWGTTGLAAFLILGVMVIMYLYLTKLTRSLALLKDEIDLFDVASENTIPPASNLDEISLLLIHFHELKKRLHASRKELLAAEKQVYHAEKLASIGRFASGIAHEINNPLNGIENCLYAIEKEPENLAQTREYLELAEEGLKHIGSVVRKLLSFSRNQSHTRTDVHLKDEVETVLSLLSFKLQRSQVEISTDFEDPLPVIKGDPNLLQELIMNLVLNSLDAVLDQGESTGDLFAGKIHIEIQREEDRLALRVRDNGGGIPQEIQDQMFDPFFTTKDQGKGTGLGLSVALGIAQVHGGTLQVVSEPNHSTEFSAQFPLEEQP